MGKNTLTVLLSFLLGLLLLAYVISNVGIDSIIRAFELISFYKYFFMFGFFFLIYLILLSNRNLLRVSSVLSVEPSFTIMTSKLL